MGEKDKLRIALVDDYETLAQGRRDALVKAGHEVSIYSFEQALAAKSEEWAGFNVLVTDASDQRTGEQRRQARDETGATYSDDERILGANVLERWVSLYDQLPLWPLLIVITTYADRERRDDLKCELLFQCGAHYILPHSAVLRDEDVVRQITQPEDEQWAARPLSDEQRKRLHLPPLNVPTSSAASKKGEEPKGISSIATKPPKSIDIANMWRLLRGASELVREYVVHGLPRDEVVGAGVREREVRKTAKTLATEVDPSAPSGSKSLYRARRIARQLFAPKQ